MRAEFATDVATIAYTGHDGKPWPDADQPMKLVILDDAKPARWVHSVQTITVVKVEPPATQPSK